MHRERKRTRSYSGYVALLCDIIDNEPSNYEEAAEKKEWKDSMIKEYQLDRVKFEYIREKLGVL